MKPLGGKLWIVSSLCALAWACAAGPSTPDAGATADAGTGPRITIRGYAYVPADLSVMPGATLTIVNEDGMAHTVTSESADGAFDGAGVNGVRFDTGSIGAGATVTLTLSSSAAVGTVIPFYCIPHKGRMATPNGHITIVAADGGSTTSSARP